MPILYAYRCPACGHTDEMRVPMHLRDLGPHCPRCHDANAASLMRRLPNTPALRGLTVART